METLPSLICAHFVGVLNEKRCNKLFQNKTTVTCPMCRRDINNEQKIFVINGTYTYSTGAKTYERIISKLIHNLHKQGLAWGRSFNQLDTSSNYRKEVYFSIYSDGSAKMDKTKVKIVITNIVQIKSKTTITYELSSRQPFSGEP
jgi:hypothetical protein